MEPMEMLKDFYDRIKNNKNLTVSDYVIVGSMSLWLNHLPNIKPTDFVVALRPSKLAYFPVFPDYIDHYKISATPHLEEREKEFNGWIYWSGTIVIPGIVGSVRTLTLSGCHAFYSHHLAKVNISPSRRHKYKNHLKAIEKLNPKLKMPRW